MKRKCKQFLALSLALITFLSGCASEGFYADEITETQPSSGVIISSEAGVEVIDVQETSEPSIIEETEPSETNESSDEQKSSEVLSVTDSLESTDNLEESKATYVSETENPKEEISDGTGETSVTGDSTEETDIGGEETSLTEDPVEETSTTHVQLSVGGSIKLTSCDGVEVVLTRNSEDSVEEYTSLTGVVQTIPLSGTDVLELGYFPAESVILVEVSTAEGYKVEHYSVLSDAGDTLNEVNDFSTSPNSYAGSVISYNGMTISVSFTEERQTACDLFVKVEGIGTAVFTDGEAYYWVESTKAGISVSDTDWNPLDISALENGYLPIGSFEEGCEFVVGLSMDEVQTIKYLVQNKEGVVLSEEQYQGMGQTSLTMGSGDYYVSVIFGYEESEDMSWLEEIKKLDWRASFKEKGFFDEAGADEGIGTIYWGETIEELLAMIHDETFTFNVGLDEYFMGTIYEGTDYDKLIWLYQNGYTFKGLLEECCEKNEPNIWGLISGVRTASVYTDIYPGYRPYCIVQKTYPVGNALYFPDIYGKEKVSVYSIKIAAEGGEGSTYAFCIDPNKGMKQGYVLKLVKESRNPEDIVVSKFYDEAIRQALGVAISSGTNITETRYEYARIYIWAKMKTGSDTGFFKAYADYKCQVDSNADYDYLTSFNRNDAFYSVIDDKPSQAPEDWAKVVKKMYDLFHDSKSTMDPYEGTFYMWTYKGEEPSDSKYQRIISVGIPPQNPTPTPGINTSTPAKNRFSITIAKKGVNGEFLEGATFEVADSKGLRIGNGTSGADGMVEIDVPGPGTYFVKEIKAPEGYVLDPTMRMVELTSKNTIKLPADTQSGDSGVSTLDITPTDPPKTTNTPKSPDPYIYVKRLIFENAEKHPLGKLTIKKIDDKGNFLPGCSFYVTGPNGYRKTVEVASEAGYTIEELEEGTYTIVEQSVPEGYELDTTVYRGYINAETNWECVFTQVNKSLGTLVWVNKYDKGTVDYVSHGNGVFQIYDSEGEFVTAITNCDSAMKVWLEPGDYTLVEYSAPNGYLKADDVKFSVPEYDSPNLDNPYEVVMEEDFTKLQFKKVDKTTGEGVAGAVLWLYRLNNYGEAGTVIAKMISRDGGWCYPTEVEGEPVSNYDTHRYDEDTFIYKIPIGEYILREVEAPPGYLRGEDQKITVRAVGEVQYYEMQDTTVKLSILKVDKDDNPLAGAYLELYEANVSDASKGIYTVGNFVESWVSTTSPHILNGNVQMDQWYVLRETKAPEGYESFGERLIQLGHQHTTECFPDPTPSFVYGKHTQEDWDLGLVHIKPGTDNEECTFGEIVHFYQYWCVTCYNNIWEMYGYDEAEEWKNGEAHRDISNGSTGKLQATGYCCPVCGWSGSGWNISEDKAGDAAKSWLDRDKKWQEEYPGQVDVGTNMSSAIGDLYNGVHIDCPFAVPDNGGQPVCGSEEFVLEGDTLKLTVANKDREDTPHNIIVQISKYGADVQAPIVGATLQVYTADAYFNKISLYQQWVTGSDGYGPTGLAIDHTIMNMPAGNYVLVEANPPEGYTTAPDVKFTVEDVTKPQTVSMTDTETIISIAKESSEGGYPLAGAKLELWAADMSKKYESWTTTAERYEIHKIPVGRYKIVETYAPPGYRLSDPVEIEVKDVRETQYFRMLDEPILARFGKVNREGKLIAGAHMVLWNTNASGNKTTIYSQWWSSDTDYQEFVGIPAGTYYLEDDTAPKGYVKAGKKVVVTSSNEPQVITLENPEITIEIGKTDIHTNSLLAGTEMYLWYADSEGNSTGRLYATWTTTAEPKRFSRIPAGYYLLEEVVPTTGYDFAEPLFFEVKEQEELQSFVMEDDYLYLGFELTKVDGETGEIIGHKFDDYGDQSVATFELQEFNNITGEYETSKDYKIVYEGEGYYSVNTSLKWTYGGTPQNGYLYWSPNNDGKFRYREVASPYAYYLDDDWVYIDIVEEQYLGNEWNVLRQASDGTIYVAHLAHNAIPWAYRIFNEVQFANSEIRGNFEIVKWDTDKADTGQENIPQGDASLEGFEFTIYNRGVRPIFYYPDGNPDIEFDEDGFVSSIKNREYFNVGSAICTIVTDKDGYASTAVDSLPYGTYEVVETKVGEGFMMETNNSVSNVGSITFSIDASHRRIRSDNDGLYGYVNYDGENIGTQKFIKNDVIRGGVQIQKWDIELDKSTALGGKDHGKTTDGTHLDGITFEIKNVSKNPVYVDGTWYNVGTVVKSIKTHWNEELNCYTAETESDTLPYGTYEIYESATAEGYLLNSKVYTFEIREDGKIVTVDTEGNLLVTKDQVIRGDFSLVKMEEKSHRLMKVAFEVENVATGEKHIIVTDKNGNFNSSSRNHSIETNANDWAIGSDENTVISSDSLNENAGVWFGKAEDGSVATPNDGLGALPYGTYRVRELRSDTNEGLTLQEFTIRIYRDSINYDLDTVYNSPDDIPVTLKSSALDAATGTHSANPYNGLVTIVDNVDIKGLKSGTGYRVVGTLMSANREDEEILYNKEKVTDSIWFRAEHASASVNLSFTFDASKYIGEDVVVYVEVYRADSETSKGTLVSTETGRTHGKDVDNIAETVSITPLAQTKKHSHKSP